MNGVAFTNLPQLALLDLKYNVCINKFFGIDRGQNKFRWKISRNCAPADGVKKKITCSASSACNEMRDEWFEGRLGRAQDSSGCCELDYGTHIDAPDFTFVADTNYALVETLAIAHQQNVEFLPVSIHEIFLSLKFYMVINTPVPKVSRRNFEKLHKLVFLNLDRNQIEVIKSDTFKDLVNLKWICIGMNYCQMFKVFLTLMCLQ